MSYISSSTLSRHRYLVSTIQEGMNKVDSVYKKLGSGKNINSWSELTPYDSALLQDYNQKILNIEKNINVLNEQNLKSSIVIDAIDNIYATISEIMHNAIKARSPAMSGMIPITSLAKQALAHMQTNLNVSYQNDYIFSGSKVNVPPIEDITINNVVGEYGYSNIYYKGGCGPGTINAGEQAFQKAIAAMHILTIGDASKIERAIDMLEEAQNEVLEYRTNIAYDIKQTSSEIDKQDRMLLLLTNRKSEITDTDTVKAMIEAANLANAIEATLTCTAKMSDLSITKYL